jgi:hypothetical protein
VSFEPIDHRARLLAGAAVGHLNGDVLAGLLLPVLGECRIELLVQLPGRIVGDVQDRGVGQSIGRRVGHGQDSHSGAEPEPRPCHLDLPWSLSGASDESGFLSICL